MAPPPLPPAIAAYLSSVVDVLRDVLGSDLVAVWTTGSLALGDYHQGRSDVDVMVVVESGHADALREMGRRLDHAALPCPAAGLELVGYPRATVAAPRLDAGYVLNLNTGAALPPVVSLEPDTGAAFWFALDRSITAQSGQPLHGPPPVEVMTPVPHAQLLPVVADSVRGHVEHLEAHLLDNAALNGVRALRYALDARWYAKLEAARRSLPHLGRHAAVVRAAMSSYDEGRAPTTVLDVDAVRALLDEVVGRVDGVTRLT